MNFKKISNIISINFTIYGYLPNILLTELVLFGCFTVSPHLKITV